MKNWIQKTKDLYNKATKYVPDTILHFGVNFCATLAIGPAFATGLSIGRESVRLNQLDNKEILKDTIWDLVADAAGIISAATLRLLVLK